MGDILKSYVQKVQELPTLPSTAHEILNLTVNPLLSIEQLQRIIERDPAISAKILSVANSAFFSYPVRITKIDDAIIRIGFNSVKSIAVGISILSFLNDGRTSSDYRRLFNHCVTVSLTSRYIAKNLRLSISEDILIDGLLHDLGYMVLLRSFPTIFQKILSAHEQTGALLRAEKNILSYTHSDVGFWLADHWNLPETVLDATLYHHTPSLAKRNEQLLAVIHIADYIAAKNIYYPIEKNPNYPLDHGAFDILTISENDFKDMEESIDNVPLSDDIFNVPHDAKSKVYGSH